MGFHHFAPLLILINLFCMTLHASQSEDTYNDLQKDIRLFQSLMKTYHPGLYRYHTEQSFDALIEESLQLAAKHKDQADAFLIMTKLAAGIQCGHTMVNPYNQSKAVQAQFINHSNALPLFLKKIEGRWFIELDTSESPIFKRGDELIAINGVSMQSLIDQMLTYVVSDGGNWQKRHSRLEMSGYSTKQWFDILLPLLNPPVNGKYTVDVIRKDDHQRVSVSLAAQSSKQRRTMIAKTLPEYAKTSEQRWEYRMLRDDLAYLRFHSFATFNMDIDWEAFINNAFEFFAAKQAQSLILDIRGNGGGMYDVVKLLYRHIGSEAMQITRFAEHAVYTKVSAEERKIMSTWNPAVYDISEWIKRKENRHYVINDVRTETVERVKNPFEGPVYILIDGANNSATFTMSKELKETGRATLIGETNGGNLRGTNGGQQFFVTFPNTGIEVDLPLIGYFPATPQEDAGLVPDIYVKQTFSDWNNGIDRVLETALDKASH